MRRPLRTPAHAQFQPAAPLPIPRHSHGAALMADGRVMLAGGLGSTIAVSSSAVVYDPVADAWSIGPSLAAARLDFPLVRLLSGRLLAISGYVPSGGAYEPTAGKLRPVDECVGCRGFSVDTAPVSYRNRAP